MGNRRRASLIERSIYLIDYECERLGVSRRKLFDEVAEGYKECGIAKHTPKNETLMAYEKGRRPIPFESAQANVPTWLDVCDYKVGEAYASYFHPFFTLFFGPLQSSAHVRAGSQFVPTAWLDAAREEGDTVRLQKYAIQNRSVGRGLSERGLREDRLTRVHCCLLSLPEDGRNGVMVRKGLSSFWRRAWGDPVAEVNVARRLEGLDALSLLAGLALEAALIGDEYRLKVARHALFEGLSVNLDLPRFRRIHKWVRRVVIVNCAELSAWRYQASLGYGYPAAIRGQLSQALMNERIAVGERRRRAVTK